MDVHTLVAAVSLLVPMVSPFVPAKKAFPLLVVGLVASFSWMTIEAQAQATVYFWMAVATFLLDVVLLLGSVFSPLTKEAL